jgi:hypothetical protein
MLDGTFLVRQERELILTLVFKVETLFVLDHLMIPGRSAPLRAPSGRPGDSLHRG